MLSSSLVLNVIIITSYYIVANALETNEGDSATANTAIKATNIILPLIIL
jgi:hypothetical protein